MAQQQNPWVLKALDFELRLGKYKVDVADRLIKYYDYIAEKYGKSVCAARHDGDLNADELLALDLCNDIFKIKDNNGQESHNWHWYTGHGWRY